MYSVTSTTANEIAGMNPLIAFIFVVGIVVFAAICGMACAEMFIRLGVL